MNNNELFLINYNISFLIKRFNFDMVELLYKKFILFAPKFNSFNFLNFIFSNTFISYILLLYKFNFFNSLKLTFSNILISDILL